MLTTVVTTLVNREFDAGSYLFTQDVSDARDGRIQNGVYFLYLEAQGKRETRKFIVTK